MELSKAAQIYYDLCFDVNGKSLCIQPYFNSKVDKQRYGYCFTEKVLDELLKTGRIKCTYRSKKYVNICGTNENGEIEFWL